MMKTLNDVAFRIGAERRRPAWTGSLGGADTIYSCEAFGL